MPRREHAGMSNANGVVLTTFNPRNEDTHMATYGKKASDKVGDAMHERKQGTLKSGRSGKKVTSQKQAIAIGLSEARKEGGKVPAKKGAAKKSSAKKSSAKKSSAKKSGARKTAAKKSSGRKTSTRKTAAKKSTGRKTATKKSGGARKASAKKTARKSTAKRSSS
jgi:hypothetical protein